jgi:MFS family permease
MSHAATYATEFRAGWKTVLGGTLGTAFGISALPFYTLGVFLKPITDATGWSREAVQLGFAAQMFGMLLFGWAWGAAVDRFGARPVALVSQAGFGISLILLPSFATSLTGWYLGWALVALLGAGTSPVTWTRGITGWFDGARGAALGLALMGTGFAALIAPPLITALIADGNWQQGYRALGLSVLLLALPLVALTFRDAPAIRAASQPLPGLDRAAALRRPAFWIMLFVFAALTLAIAGIIPSVVPLLTDRGMSASEAAAFASLAGLAVIIGRVSAGLLIDRFWAPAVATMLLMLPAIACLILVGGLPSPALIGLAVFLVGLAAGAEFDLVAYLTGRYFGMRHYGFLYAIQTIGLLVAGGFAPALFGRVYDATASYDMALSAALGIFLLVPPLLLLMGRYPTSFAQNSEGQGTSEADGGSAAPLSRPAAP